MVPHGRNWGEGPIKGRGRELLPLNISPSGLVHMHCTCQFRCSEKQMLWLDLTCKRFIGESLWKIEGRVGNTEGQIVIRKERWTGRASEPRALLRKSCQAGGECPSRSCRWRNSGSSRLGWHLDPNTAGSVRPVAGSSLEAWGLAPVQQWLQRCGRGLAILLCTGSRFS